MNEYKVFQDLTEKLNNKVQEVDIASTFLDKAIENLTKVAKPAIDKLLQEIEAIEDTIKIEIAKNPQKFKKPKSKVFNGIKIGIARSTPKLTVDNEDVTIAEIEKVLPALKHSLIKTKTIKTLNRSEIIKGGEKLMTILGVSLQELGNTPSVKVMSKGHNTLLEHVKKQRDSS